MFRFLLTVLLLVFAPTAEAQSMRAPRPSDGWERIEALDATFEAPDAWVTVEGLHARVHAPRVHAALAEGLGNHAARSVPRIAEALGVPTGQRMDVVLTASPEHFRRLQPGRPPDWADATAWPSLGRIFLRTPDQRGPDPAPIEQVLDHEITHVLLGRAFHPADVPTWLQEGLAQYVAGELGPETARTLAWGATWGGLLTLDDLSTGFPSDPLRARVAYAQSADLVAWVAGEHGEQSLVVLVQALQAGLSFDAAMHRATGRWPDEVDRAWRSRLDRVDFRLGALAGDAGWWALAVVAVPFAVLGVRRRNRRTLARWRAEEELEVGFRRWRGGASAPGAGGSGPASSSPISSVTVH